jgi:tyrosyl-tRNA synthetase
MATDTKTFTFDQQLALGRLLTGIVQSAGVEHIEAALLTGRPLKVKFGMDPTAPDLHMGHAVALRKLRDFQDAGHEAILVIGSFTAQIGDPTGKNKTRPSLSAQEVEANATTYLAQAFKILDASKTTVVRNSQWLGAMNAVDIIGLMSKVTLSQILAREDFKNRYETEQPIALHEMLYPLLQGMDSVELHADVELGGTDQWFNLHMGRALQEKSGQLPQAVLVVPLMVGLDGVNKMSKSLDNHLALAGDPVDTYGRFMSVSDDTMWKMLPMMGLWETSRIASEKNDCANGLRNPMHAKMAAARDLITMLHGQDEALRAEEAFVNRHVHGKTVEDVPVFTVSGNDLMLSTVLRDAGVCKSSGDAARTIEQGGVRVDGTRAVKGARLGIGEHYVEVGKRRAVRVVVEAPDTAPAP